MFQGEQADVLQQTLGGMLCCVVAQAAAGYSRAKQAVQWQRLPVASRRAIWEGLVADQDCQLAFPAAPPVLLKRLKYAI